MWKWIENKKFFPCLVCAVLLAWLLHGEADAQGLAVGEGSFVYKTPVDKKRIRVWYYKPKAFNNASQVVFVMHGMKRNAKQYRDTWLGHAKHGRFLLLVPEFSKGEYPGSAAYNLGNMFSSSGEPNDEALWSYSIIEHLFDHIKTIAPSDAAGYNIYGHSAGAQFVHRLVLFKPNARILSAVAANAGWYTLPTDEVEFPYGLKGSGFKETTVLHALAKNLTILLGSKDTDPNHKHLRRSPQAMLQGQHRFERGQTFYEKATATAKRHQAHFKWDLITIYGVGHSNSLMSVHAVQLFNSKP